MLSRLHGKLQGKKLLGLAVLIVVRRNNIHLNIYNAYFAHSRLNISPSASSYSVATQATSEGRRFLHGRKRKMKARKREHSAGFKTVQHASSSGKVSIEEIDADGNFVRLKNNSDEVLVQFCSSFTAKYDRLCTDLWLRDYNRELQRDESFPNVS